jgi:NitT/TauT family transport system substrate-binding protein
MGKFVIQPHVRLQEWVAEEHGFFGDQALDYAFEPEQAILA